MIRSVFLLSILLLPGIFSSAQQTIAASELLQVNYAALIARADLHYQTPVSRSEEGMPIGNGRMGTLVWTVPSAIRMQMNRVDLFGNGSASNNFYERNTDYCGGAGAVNIDPGEPVFTAGSFEQHLSCYDGLVSVKGKGINADILAWHEKDVMAIQVKDQRKQPLPVHIDLHMLRPPVVKRGDHSAISTLTIKDQGNDPYIVLTQTFKEGDFYCASAVVIAASGKTFAEVVHETTIRLSVQATDNFSVYMASASTFDPKEDVVQKAMHDLKAAQQKGYEALLADNKTWWHRFWEKGFIDAGSPDGEAGFVAANYAYYLYTMACTSRGDYPTKFNGMLWSTDGDSRKWGGLYWGANQSCLYNALPASNRLELMQPMFNMYSKAYNSYAKAAEQQWGSKGIFIPEVTGFDETPPLPDSIAAEMRELYLVKKPWNQRSAAFTAYAYTKLPFISRWNWKKDSGWKEGRWYSGDKGGGVFGHTTHIFSRGAKIAYQYWQQFEYTQDTQWLRQYAYPMLKGVAEFYRNFPHVKKEHDGKYHIYHVNDNESIWDGHNTVEEISSMMGILPAAIKAASILNTDMNMRKLWQEFIDNLSPLPLNESKTNFAGSLPPALQGNPARRPDGNTMPVWFFDLCTLESKDAARMRIANATFNEYYRNGIDRNTRVNVLSKLPVAGVLLGRKDATRYLVPNQIRTAEIPVMPNRMDLREGFQTTSVQRLGRAAEALQLALCQSVPPAPGAASVIHFFPAWPVEWNAAFTLLARGGFLVSGSFRDGQVQFAELLSQYGGECRIRNPWPGKRVDVYINNRKERSTGNSLLILRTRSNDRVILVPAGTSLAGYRQQVKVSIP